MTTALLKCHSSDKILKWHSILAFFYRINAQTTPPLSRTSDGTEEMSADFLVVVKIVLRHNNIALSIHPCFYVSPLFLFYFFTFLLTATSVCLLEIRIFYRYQFGPVP